MLLERLIISLFVGGAGFVTVSSAYNSSIRALTFVVSYVAIMFVLGLARFKVIVSLHCSMYDELEVVQETKTSATFQQ